MSKNQVRNLIHRELDFLNERIDMQIIKGQAYSQDAKRHQLLLAKLRRIRQSQNARGFARLSFF